MTLREKILKITKDEIHWISSFLFLGVNSDRRYLHILRGCIFYTKFYNQDRNSVANDKDDEDTRKQRTDSMRWNCGYRHDCRNSVSFFDFKL